jgi:hypothetical protein
MIYFTIKNKINTSKKNINGGAGFLKKCFGTGCRTQVNGHFLDKMKGTFSLETTAGRCKSRNRRM